MYTTTQCTTQPQFITTAIDSLGFTLNDVTKISAANTQQPNTQRTQRITNLQPGPLVVGELHFARLACAPKSRPQTMRRAPRTARLGKLPGGALGRFGRADFRDQPPRAHAVVAGRVPAKSRDPRRDFCPKPRPGEKRGPHIDRHLTSRCCRTRLRSSSATW